MKKKYYSYSQLSTFKNCPQKYKIQYIDKVKNNDESIESFLGKRIHESLEWLYQKSKKDSFISFDRLSKKFVDIWNNSWHSNIYEAYNPYKKNKAILNKEQYMKIALNNLSLFYSKFFNHNNNHKYTEHNFDIDINGKNFKGVIDRIDVFESYIDIIDYKTGKTKKKLTVMDKIQLYIYQLFVKEKYRDKKIFLNWLYVNSNGDQKRISISEKDEKKYKKKVLSIINDMDSSVAENSFPSKESFLCNWCYYWNECELKSDLNEKNPAKNL
tara:strand:+ start:1159 stop:1968 length:810 start_codon:yes stop_codon:yes gene_type:complete